MNSIENIYPLQTIQATMIKKGIDTTKELASKIIDSAEENSNKINLESIDRDNKKLQAFKGNIINYYV